MIDMNSRDMLMLGPKAWGIMIDMNSRDMLMLGPGANADGRMTCWKWIAVAIVATEWAPGLNPDGWVGTVRGYLRAGPSHDTPWLKGRCFTVVHFRSSENTHVIGMVESQSKNSGMGMDSIRTRSWSIVMDLDELGVGLDWLTEAT